MRWFTRQPRSRFPADMPRRMEMLGRFELDPVTSDIDAATVASECVVPFLEASKADPDGFLLDLRALVAADRGGFATYGASRLVWEMFSSTFMNMPAALPLIDAAIDFKIARGLAGMHLTGYEAQRLAQRRATTT